MEEQDVIEQAPDEAEHKESCANASQPKSDPSFSFPSGLDIKDYADYSDWPKSKWAWEFLRRNPNFQAGCQELHGMPDIPLRRLRKKNAAQRFGLKKFKHFEEDYGAGSEPIPAFKTSSISYWSRVNEGRYAEQQLPTSLRRGEALVRFDIAAMTRSTKSLEAQLNEAARRLEKSLRKYQSKDASKADPTKHKAPLIELLRTLDAFRQWEEGLIPGLTVLQIANAILTRYTTDAERKIKRRYARAIEYRDTDYLDLAASEDRIT